MLLSFSLVPHEERVKQAPLVFLLSFFFVDFFALNLWSHTTARCTAAAPSAAPAGIPPSTPAAPRGRRRATRPPPSSESAPRQRGSPWP